MQHGLVVVPVDSHLFEQHMFKPASSHPHWQHTMSKELQALHKNATWSLVPHDPNVNIVGSRWVY